MYFKAFVTFWVGYINYLHYVKTKYENIQEQLVVDGEGSVLTAKFDKDIRTALNVLGHLNDDIFLMRSLILESAGIRSAGHLFLCHPRRYTEVLSGIFGTSAKLLLNSQQLVILRETL